MIENVKYTRHAVDEARKELMKELDAEVAAITIVSDAAAVGFIKSSMRQATYISEITDARGKTDRLYAYRRYCFVLDRYDDVVITVYRRDHVHEDIRSIVKELLFQKLADLEAVEKILVEERLQADMRHKLELHINMALGANSFKHTHKELVAWEELREIERKLIEFRLEKSKIAKGIAAYV